MGTGANFTYKVMKAKPEAIAMIDEVLANPDIDNRLTIGQSYQLMNMSLGGDPLLLAARQIKVAMDPRSKWKVDPQWAIKMLLELARYYYAMPDGKSRKVGNQENEFQLEFAWANGDGAISLKGKRDGE